MSIHASPGTAPPTRAVIIAAALLAVHAAAARADPVSAPGEWYDQDKTNDGQYDPARSKLVGMSWNYWFDDDGNGVYTYGEDWREHHLIIDPNDNQQEDPGETWGDWHVSDDDSCWAAAAANLVRYVGAGDRYMGWVYEGTWADGSTWTWEESGKATEALAAEGFGVQFVSNEAGGGVWAIDPAAWIQARLADGLPVVIACGSEHDFGTGPFSESTHAVTVYAIDTSAQILVLADNSREFSNGDFTEFDYTFESGVLRLPDYRGAAHLNKASTFDMTEWQGAGAGGADGDWHDPANWSGGQVPDVAHPLLVPRMEFTGPGTAYVMGVAQAQMLIARGGDGAFLILPAGHLTLGNLHLADAKIIVQGDLQVHRGDVLSGHLDVRGGTVAVTFDADGGSGDLTCGGAITVQDNGTLNVADDFTTAPGACTLAIESGSTMAVDGDLCLAAGDLAVQNDGTFTVGGDLVGRPGVASAYGLSGIDTRLETDTATIGDGAVATFTQDGGFVKVAQDVYLGSGAGAYGTYYLDGGVLSAGGHVYCGYAGGTGTLAMGGGTLETSSNSVYVATPADRLVGWGTVAGSVQNTGTLHAVGGTLTLKGKYVGRGPVSIDPGATLALWSDASLSGPTANDGRLRVVAGTAEVLGGLSGQGDLRVDASACLTVNSDLSAGAVDVWGMLSLPSPWAEITVGGGLTLHDTAELEAPAGACVRMTGSAFANYSTDESALADLAEIELVFVGGAAVVDPFEVASLPGGGFHANFALGTLTLGDAAVGRVRLVDLADNGNRGPHGRECLFLHDLTIGSGSELDLNGLDLYLQGDATGLLAGWIADDRLIDATGRLLGAAFDGGSGWTSVPEPATLALLAAGSMGVLIRRRE